MIGIFYNFRQTPEILIVWFIHWHYELVYFYSNWPRYRSYWSLDHKGTQLNYWTFKERIHYQFYQVYFSFNSKMFNHVSATAMATKYAPSYACVTIGCQEKTKSFTQELRKCFWIGEFKVIKEVLKWYMYDSFTFLPKHVQSCS